MVLQLGTASVVSSLGKYLSIKTGPNRTEALMVVLGYHNQNLGNLGQKAGERGGGQK
jgi:hypothetical protein|tara:strand:- start:315 stop:485 length:171 start_codon:yes stop_codon:yes gene_type:complete